MKGMRGDPDISGNEPSLRGSISGYYGAKAEPTFQEKNCGY